MTSTDGGASDLAMATDLSNAVQKKNTRNANNDAPVSNNQDLLDLLDLDLSAVAPTTSIMPGLQQLGTTTTTTDHNLRGLDLNLGAFGSIGTIDTMSSSIPTNGNDLASMLGGLSAPVNPVLPVLPVLGGVGDMSSNLLGELSTTTTANNVTVVRVPKLIDYTAMQSLIASFRIFFSASTGSQIDGPGQERTACAAGAGEGQRLHEDLYDNHKQLRQYTGAVFAKGKQVVTVPFSIHSPIPSFSSQAAVQKSFELQMLPPSGSMLPPGGVITQEMRVVATSNVSQVGGLFSYLCSIY